MPWEASDPKQQIDYPVTHTTKEMGRGCRNTQEPRLLRCGIARVGLPGGDVLTLNVRERGNWIRRTEQRDDREVWVWGKEHLEYTWTVVSSSRACRGEGKWQRGWGGFSLSGTDLSSNNLIVTCFLFPPCCNTSETLGPTDWVSGFWFMMTSLTIMLTVFHIPRKALLAIPESLYASISFSYFCSPLWTDSFFKWQRMSNGFEKLQQRIWQISTIWITGKKKFKKKFSLCTRQHRH